MLFYIELTATEPQNILLITGAGYVDRNLRAFGGVEMSSTLPFPHSSPIIHNALIECGYLSDSGPSLSPGVYFLKLQVFRGFPKLESLNYIK